MELYRHSIKEDACSREADSPEIIGRKSEKAHYKFNGFGNGGWRFNDFSVYVTWADVEAMIDAFAKAGLPQALSIRNNAAALKRVRAALKTR